MSYTDNIPAPAPTKSERAFAQLTESQREQMTIYWLICNVPLSPERSRLVNEYHLAITEAEETV